MGNVQQNQNTNRAKISHMEVQVGNIPNKLKDYEQSLWLLIKESSNKMEQVTYNIFFIATNLGKHTNEEIMLSRGPSKRTR